MAMHCEKNIDTFMFAWQKTAWYPATDPEGHECMDTGFFSEERVHRRVDHHQL